MLAIALYQGKEGAAAAGGPPGGQDPLVWARHAVPLPGWGDAMSPEVPGNTRLWDRATPVGPNSFGQPRLRTPRLPRWIRRDRRVGGLGRG